MLEDQSSCATNQGTCGSRRKKWLMGSLAVFVFIIAFDWLVHGVLLKDTYTGTSALWRAPVDMQAMAPLTIGMYAALAVVFAKMFGFWHTLVSIAKPQAANYPYRIGFKLGVLTGLLISIQSIAVYIYMPIPAHVAIAWFAPELVKWSLAGMLLAHLYKRCNKVSSV